MFPDLSWNTLKSQAPVILSKAIAAVLLVVLGVTVEDQFKDWWIGPKTYKVYLVGSLTDGPTQRIFRGFEKQHELLTPTIAGVPVEAEVVDDLGTADGARQVSRLIAARNDALLVVGHVMSTDTKAALPNYVQASPPLPVIATRETSPDLTMCCRAVSGLCPIIRMSPTDTDEARDLVAYAVAQGKRRFLVVAGDVNAEYALPLAHLIQNAINATGKALVNDFFPSRSQIPPQRLVGGNYDCILVSGEPGDAISLMTRIKEEFSKVNGAQEPLVILSDASFDRTLLAAGNSQLMQGVLLTYQLGHNDEDQPYHTYGLDAFDLVNSLVSQANGRIMANNVTWGFRLRRAINMHRVTDARDIVLAALRDFTQHHASLLSSSGEDYSFDSNGSRLNGRFHMWKVSGTTFVDIDGEKDAPSRPALAARRQGERPLTRARSAGRTSSREIESALISAEPPCCALTSGGGQTAR